MARLRLVALVAASVLLAGACGQQGSDESVAERPLVDTTIDFFPDTTETSDEPAPPLEKYPATDLVTELDLTVPDTTTDAFGDGLIWIGTYLGYSENLTDVTFVLAPDGSVLRVHEGNIYAGGGSYLTWNIGPAGYQAVMGLVAKLVDDTDDLRTNDGQAGTIRSDSRSFTLRELHAPADQLTDSQQLARANFKRLLAKLENMQWMEGFTTVTQRVPWIPDQLAFEVSDEFNSQYYVTDPFPWPFDQSVAAMVDVDGDPPVICLDGADAETAWNTLVLDGVNNRRIPVADGGRLVELGALISHPLYNISSNPCRGSTEFGIGSSSNRAEHPDISSLLLSQEDVGSEWSVGLPSVTPPPPAVEQCLPVTDPEIAVAEFDSWITHTVDLDRAGASQYQYLGAVPAGVDAASVVERIGSASCIDGLARFGVRELESGILANPPPGVTAAAYWILRYDGATGVVIDASLDNGLVMIFGSTSSAPLTPADLEPNFSLAVAKAASG